MDPLMIVVTLVVMYAVVAWLLLRFMGFITSCDREIRVMTKYHRHQKLLVFRPGGKARKTLRFRPASP